MAVNEDLARDYEPDRKADRETEAQWQVAHTHLDTRSVCLLILTALAVLWALEVAQEIVVPFILAAILNLLLQPAKRLLCDRLRMPAALAAVLLILAVFAAIGGIATAISLPASNWVGRAPEALPRLEQKLGPLRQPFDYLQNGLQRVEHAMQPAGGQQQQQQTVTVSQSSANLSSVGLAVLSHTRAFLAQLLTIVAILFFLLIAGETLVRSLVEIMPRFGAKRRVVEISDEIEHNISGYLATITVMNALVGIANGLSTWACGLPDPLLWGTLAFLLNYVPILGPFTGIVVFFLVGLFTYDTIWWALLPPGIYLLIHMAEGETITPMLLARRFTLNPVLVILSLFFWDWMWGVIGALLAVPLLAICKIVCDHVPTLTPLGHLIGGGRKGGSAAAAE